MLMWKLRASFCQATLLGIEMTIFRGKNVTSIWVISSGHLEEAGGGVFLVIVLWQMSAGVEKKHHLLRSQKLSLIKLKWWISTRKTWSQAFHIFHSPPQKSNLLRGTFLHPFQKEVCLPNNLKSDHFSDCCLGVILPNIWDEININIFLIIHAGNLHPLKRGPFEKEREDLPTTTFQGTC